MLSLLEAEDIEDFPNEKSGDVGESILASDCEVIESILDDFLIEE